MDLLFASCQRCGRNPAEASGGSNDGCKSPECHGCGVGLAGAQPAQPTYAPRFDSLPDSPRSSSDRTLPVEAFPVLPHWQRQLRAPYKPPAVDEVPSPRLPGLPAAAEEPRPVPPPPPARTESQELDDLCKQLGLKRCPKCKNACEKDERSGENVKCICGHEFCWLCLQDVEKIRRHGNHFHEASCRLYGVYGLKTTYEEKCPYCVRNGVACVPPKPPFKRRESVVLWHPDMALTKADCWVRFAKGLLFKGPIERTVTRIWADLGLPTSSGVGSDEDAS